MSNSTPTPKVSRASRISLVWIVPIIAVVIAAWMILREWHDHGPEVTISFTDGSGIEANKTELEYKGVSVGRVTKVTLNQDLSGAEVELRLDKTAAKLARSGSEFWVVHPEIGFSGVKGLDTLVSGVRLNVRPGEGPPANKFRGLDKPPAPDNPEDGKAFVLRTDRLGSLAPQASVLYRDIKVGVVETSRLSDDSTSVLIRIRVQKPYTDLIRSNTQFWNAGGIPLKISLFGSSLRSTSLESILAGAISFATPDQLGPVAAEDTEFKLNTESDKDWLKWKPAIPIQPADEAQPTKKPASDALPQLLKE